MSPVIVLYDADCGFCRWATAQAVSLDRRGVLVPVPIQSSLGDELLGDLDPSARLRAAHVVGDDGRRRSGGAAAAEVLAALPPTQALARLAHRWPRTTNLLYALVAWRRRDLGRLVGPERRQRADRLLQASSATTAEVLEIRSIRLPAVATRDRSSRKE
jgi:predicted DCC family thiol-disulfide oxidoreductase YuxK